jgi:hypothetical protein
MPRRPFWLAAVCAVQRLGLFQHPSRVDSKGPNVPYVRAGSCHNVINLGDGLGSHHLVVVAACLTAPALGPFSFEGAVNGGISR